MLLPVCIVKWQIGNTDVINLSAEHQNYFGVDDNLGPVAVTIRREKLDEKERDTPTGKNEGVGHCYHYRLIVRTSEVSTTVHALAVNL